MTHHICRNCGSDAGCSCCDDARARVATLEAAQTADEERVRAVVRESVVDTLATYAAPTATLAEIQVASVVLGNVIATRAAKQLATPRARETREQYDARTGTTRHTVPVHPATVRLTPDDVRVVERLRHRVLGGVLSNADLNACVNLLDRLLVAGVTP